MDICPIGLANKCKRRKLVKRITASFVVALRLEIKSFRRRLGLVICYPVKMKKCQSIFFSFVVTNEHTE
ncbi:hypothetical protein M0804_009608 [Polistes exclamans]|nr:hypothetical protein M0804_009608 [Polistes exclamans]